MTIAETILEIANFFLRVKSWASLSVEIKCNILWEINDRATEPQISHKSELANAECWSLDTKRLIPTPTAVIATTNKKCDYNIDTLILFAFNLFKLHYLLQLLIIIIIIIIIVAMENKIADPSVENWKTGL